MPLRPVRARRLRSLARRDTGFVYLARNVPAEKAAKIQRMQIPGLEFIPEYRRTYPRDWMAAQLLGSVGTDDQGLGGLEYDFNKELQGTNGERKLVKDRTGLPRPDAERDVQSWTRDRQF